MFPLNRPNTEMNAICTEYLRNSFFNQQHQLFTL